ncbi:MAG TPA: GNAT family N-acetyltransferase [Anaerolineales bacterium]|nr:GNAT family N-acetyltransferase [Anaerolineales bacterium]
MPITIENIEYLQIDESWRSWIVNEWNEKVERHLHFSDGFTIVALHEQHSIGIISVYWRQLPAPLPDTIEGYVNIVEVRPAYRKRGIARQLIDLSIQKACEHKAYQLRSWSSEDKVEAIPMWKRLGFGLCPATTFPRGQEVHGFFVTKILKNELG